MNRVERFGRTVAVTQDSGWMGGGHTQPEWCNNLIGNLRNQFPPDSQFKVLSSSERSKSSCTPFNCPQYNYTCTVEVQTDPIYNEKSSPKCPR